jgi:hypothetical protein
MMNSGGIPAELSHSGLIPADSGNSGLIPVDSGLIPADSGAIPPESAGITGFRTESVGHQKVQKNRHTHSLSLGLLTAPHPQ